MEQNTQPEEQQPTPVTQKENLAVPIAIVAAGALIALAIFFNHSSSSQNQNGQTNLLQAASLSVAPVSPQDHILGASNADVTIVEYSDTECPFCKQFQATLHQVLTDYSASGSGASVAWVYRHFPLSRPDAQGHALHPRAEKEAESTECVNELAGNQTFWHYIDSIFQITPSNNGLDPAQLPILAKAAGVNQTAFNTCLSSGKYAAAISADYDAAVKAGGQGTPYTVLLLKNKIDEKKSGEVIQNVQKAFAKIAPNATLPTDLITFDKDGQKIAFSGALPYDVVKALISSVISR